MFSFDIYDSEGQLVTSRSLERGTFNIGRAMGADIRIRDRSIARKHAALEIDSARSTIRGLDNTNRLYKDGQEIGAYGPLCVGDIITLGQCELHVLVAANASDEAGDTQRPSGRGDKQERALSTSGDQSHSGASGGAQDAVEQAEDEAAEPERGLMVTDSDNDPERLDVKQSLQNALVNSLDLYRRESVNSMSPEELRAEARKGVDKLIDERTVEVPDRFDRGELATEVAAEAVGYGPLEPLISDPDITEIMVNGPDQVYVEKNGELQEAGAVFVDERSLMRIIERIVTSVGRRVDEGSPMVDARLADGSRVNAIIPPLSLVGPSVTIRKFNHNKIGLDQMVEKDSLSENMAEFLKQCVLHRRNILVSGGTGSGKTTFLNALSENVPANERIVTIEDAAELKLLQDHVISLESRPANMEGKGAITIRDLVRNALRMRPDRILVGECRGGEALDMLQAMNTGHDGSLTTGHANSPRDLLSRLEVMVLMAGMDLPVRAVREQIASAVDIVVQQARFSDGKRRITSIVEVSGMEGDVILMQKLFEFRQRGIDERGGILGDFAGLGAAPTFYEELREGGVRLDTSIFGAPPDESLHA